MKKRVTVLGSTGSIGVNSISVIDSLGEEFELVSVSGHGQWQLLAQQARKYNLEKVVITDTRNLANLEKELEGTDTEVLGGPEHLVDLAVDSDCDILIVAIVGSAGLPAVLGATKAGKTIAIANKESLVVAGCLLMPLAQKHGATILPIDSEHSAILQAMQSGQRNEVEKIIITCSGGPFRNADDAQIACATLEDALNHPTWNMGPKITIDSATLMNKALEIIEARWLFDLEPGQIEVLVHPESIIHSLVEFCDGSVIAQMSLPDMRLPIQYALTWPHRRPCPASRLNLHELGHLTFEPPDKNRFPALKLGYEVAHKAGTAGAVLNGANEACVEAFRKRQISFTQIVEFTDICLSEHNFIEKPDLEQLMQSENWARQKVLELVSSVQKNPDKMKNSPQSTSY